MKSAKAMIPIKPQDLLRFTELATIPILKAQWGSTLPTGPAPKVDPAKIRESQLRGTPTVFEVHLGQVALSIGQERGGLPNEDGVHIVHAIRKGLQIGLFVSEAYQKEVNLELLLKKMERKELTEAQLTEAQLKNETAAAIVISCAANYASWKLSRYKPEQVGDSAVELPPGVEVSFINPPEAMQCFAYFLARALEHKQVKTGAAAVKMAMLYLDKVIAETVLKAAANAFKFAESFLEAAYKLEDEDFSITGFTGDRGAATVSATYNPAKWSEIVGNRDAKHNAKRRIHRMIAFDFVAKKSAFIEAFGEFPFITLGKGRPGTGKTLIARGTATEGDEVYGTLGLPFMFLPLPEDVVSEYQGKSAKNMLAWTRGFADPTKLKYGLVDDAENVFKTREASSTSEAQDAINGVMLRFTEGAQAPRDGSWVIDVLTNLPEKLDPAIMSRIPYRVDINGAETVEDFLDQNMLWRQMIKVQEEKGKITESFDDMRDKAGHEYFKTQAQLENLGKLYDGKSPDPALPVLKRILETVRKEQKEDEELFYGKLFYLLHKEFPLYFTSREVRNIQQLVNNRRADFDFPDDWLKKREAFVEKPFDEKVRLLLDRQRECLKGLSMKTVRLQETIQYLNVSLSIPETARRRELEQARDRIVLGIEAQKEAEAFLARTGARAAA